MISRRCREKNDLIIPRLLSQHAAVLSGDPDTIDMSTAENWLMREQLIERFRGGGVLESISNADLSYSQSIGGSSATRKSVATLINNHFNPSTAVDPSHVVLAAGGSYALNALIEQICDPGDSVMIAAPYWSGLDISLSVHNQAKVLQVHLPLDNFFTISSVDYYEEALKRSSGPVKAVLVCNPHNPIGRCYPKDTLQALLDFCGKHNLHYISDEVYALSLHHKKGAKDSSPGFVSALSLTGPRKLVHVIYSLSKDFGCSGIRLGAFITQQNDPVCLGVALSTHSQVSSLAGLLATTCILDDPGIGLFTEENGRRLKSAYEMVKKFLVQRRITFLPVNAGMFVFARLCSNNEISSEQALQQRMKKHGVVLASGTSYHMDQPGWFRLSYALPPSILVEGLHRIGKSLRVLRARPMTAGKAAQDAPQGQKRKRIEDADIRHSK